HTPIAPSAEFIGKSRAEDVVRNDRRYGDWLFQGDDMLGRILETLDQQKLADNTLVIATSDNGAEGREYAPLRESKRSIYEGGHRVPFVVRWPGRVTAGSVCREPICLNDVIATAADIVGARLPANSAEDSFSLLPLLTSAPPAGPQRGLVHQSSKGDLAVRIGDWKAVFHKDGREELFQLAEDLSETTDLRTGNDERAAKLRSLLQLYIDSGRSSAGESQENDIPLQIPDGTSSEVRGKNSRKRKTKSAM
ncbi:MAG: sulfatase-like hydrolase/transferase, partial [Planctomycetaceae bacterium]|nr:sulfatase-like hydrolase/transferase [Planctomycetaceae bacterium]